MSALLQAPRSESLIPRSVTAIQLQQPPLAKREQVRVSASTQTAVTSGRTIIAIGFERSEFSQRLVSFLHLNGMETVDMVSPDSLDQALKQFPRATVVVYSQQHSDCPHKVLGCLAASYRRCPVIVVADHSDPSDSQALFTEGANYYYEQSEGPESISRAIVWADREAA